MNKLTTMTALFSILIKQGRYEFAVRKVQQNEMLFMEKFYQLLEVIAYLKSQISVKGLIITLMLTLMIMMSAIGVVHSSHLSRQLFAEQSVLLDRNDQLQLEWAQLLLEQSAWSSPDRLESIATQQLKMHIPETEETKLVY
jgi:cell division protein FtsL